MKMTMRYDKFEIKASKTPEGFIRDCPVIGRVGILKYRNLDGSIRKEFRPPEEAFKEESLKTLEGKPVTIGHKCMVKADNVNYASPIGTVLSAGKQDGDNIVADVVLYKLDTKARELSCGYKVDLDETPGEYNGEKYDAIQRNIRYNHVAVVPKGRAGIARLNMDGSQEINEESERDDNVGMTKVRLDSGLEYDAAPEVGVYIEKMKQDAAEQKKEHDQLQAKYDTAIADNKKLKEDAVDTNKKQKENFNSAVKERVDMLDVAKVHKIEKADSMSNKDIKVAVIKAVRGDNFNLDGKSDDYIDAAFDLCKDEQEKRADIMSQQRKILNSKENNDKVDDYRADDCRNKMIESLQNAYKGDEK